MKNKVVYKKKDFLIRLLCFFLRQLLYPVSDITFWHVAAKRAIASQMFLSNSVRKIMPWNM